jgi:hypothetical protein
MLPFVVAAAIATQRVEVIQEAPALDADGTVVYPFTFVVMVDWGPNLTATCELDGKPVACDEGGARVKGPLAAGDHVLQVTVTAPSGDSWSGTASVTVLDMNGPWPRALACDPVASDGNVQLRSCDRGQERHYTLMVHDSSGFHGVEVGSISLDGAAYGTSNCCTGHEGKPRARLSVQGDVITAIVELPTWRTPRPGWGNTRSVVGTSTYGFTAICEHRACTTVMR